MSPLPDLNAPIVLFDGVCNFCNGTVNRLIAADVERRLRFASLQSEAGQRLLRHFGLPLTDFDTLVLVEGGRVYTFSDAALRIAKHLPAPWSWARFLMIVPRTLRNAVYRLFATNRYRWFGKSESCRMPGPEFEGRFIELNERQDP
jgi:predicted DCC family thiol-disulfide oxidoreductase YuxK